MTSTASRRRAGIASCAVIAALLSAPSPAIAQAVRTEIDVLVPSASRGGDRFGRSLDLDGDRLLVGAPMRRLGHCPSSSHAGVPGHALIFERSPEGSWTERATLQPSAARVCDLTGYAVALDGDWAVVTDPISSTSLRGGGRVGTEGGAAYVFRRIAGQWTEVQRLAPPAVDGSGDLSFFGVSVALSADFLAIGSEDIRSGREPGTWDTGAVYVYERDGDEWRAVDRLVAPDPPIYYEGFPDDNTNDYGTAFGSGLSLSGQRLLVGARGYENPGAAYMVERSPNGRWNKIRKLLPSRSAPDDDFGASVSLQGDRALIGAPRDRAGGASGSAYVFELTNGRWHERARLLATGFGDIGHGVSLDGDRALIGARQGRTGGSPTAGLLFHGGPSRWSAKSRLATSDGRFPERAPVALDGGQAVTGSPTADVRSLATTGGRGVPAGAVHVFDAR